MGPAQDEKDKELYVLQCADFTLTAPDNTTFKGVSQRNTSGQEFGGNTYRGKPGAEEEVEVAFATPPKLAERTDLVVKYHDLPEVKLDPAKKGK